LSELLREYSPKDGISLWLTYFFETFLGYVVGRRVIEPELRLATIKRIILLFILQTPLTLFEYRFGQNLWLNVAHNVFHLNVGWFVQLRGGTARIAACFGHAIIAGIMFVVAMALNYYLVQIYKRDKQRLGSWMSLLQKYQIPFFLLPVFLFMTNSRMPMACSVVCFLFLQIPRFKSMRTGAIIILLVVGIGSGAAYLAFDKYTSGPEDQATNEAQTSAIYRRHLVEEYAPLMKAGGWLGWGELSHPSIPGLRSIDNNYMLIQLSQGRLGLYSFYLIILESVFGLAMCAARFKSLDSLFLVFSLMGALIATFVALTTVYMGEQLPQVLFLLLGWAQSLQDTSVFGIGAAAERGMPEPKFHFKKVIV
jgi:hypothetical protein